MRSTALRVELLARTRHRAILRSAICLLAASSSARPLAAQTALLTGRVLDERTERPIPRARIEVPALKLATVTDSAGDFRLRQVTAGAHRVVVRAIGYDSLSVELNFTSRDSIDSEFILTPSATPLAAVKVEAAARGPYASRLVEFEERRAMGFGRFLDWTYFERNDGRSVGTLLSSRIPGIRAASKGSGSYLTTTRDGRLCFPQTIVNGTVQENLDLGQINARDVIGFEFYTPSTTPARFNMTGRGSVGAQCGTAIFWLK